MVAVIGMEVNVDMFTSSLGPKDLSHPMTQHINIPMQMHTRFVRVFNFVARVQLSYSSILINPLNLSM